MAWIEVFKNELYKNSQGCFLKKENGEFVLFDQDGQTIRIPIKDILENPVYKYTDAWRELKTIVDKTNLDLSNIAQNTSALYLSILAKEDIPSFAPVNLKGYKADSNFTQLIDATCQGFSMNETLTNAIGTFQANGVIQNSLWNWNVNDTIFLNGNSLSNIRPTTGILQRIGTAKTSDTIILKLSDPIRL